MITRHKLAAGIGGVALMFGTLGGAFAVHAANPPSTATATVAEQSGKTEPAETAIDPATVKITADQAKAAAQAKFPGGTVKTAELEDENGTVIWGVTLTDASGNTQNVKVDGTGGQVISAHADMPDGTETPGTENAND